MPAALARPAASWTCPTTIERAAGRGPRRIRTGCAASCRPRERSPRLGEDLFARKLALTLATPWQPAALLAQAYAGPGPDRGGAGRAGRRTTGSAAVDRAEIAAEFDRLAEDAPTSDDHPASNCRDALAETTAFVERARAADPARTTRSTSSRCPRSTAASRWPTASAVGALETAPLRTQFAVSPTPADWTAERVALLLPRVQQPHAAQPDRARGDAGPRRAALARPPLPRRAPRCAAVFGSGSFIEGWAVYAEELMAARGYRSEVSAEAAARGADAAAEDAAADGDQHHPRHLLPRRRPGRGRRRWS